MASSVTITRFKAASTVLQLGWEELELDVVMSKLRPFEEGADDVMEPFVEVPSMALYSNGKFKERRCYICGSKRHLKAQCPKRDQGGPRAYGAVAL